VFLHWDRGAPGNSSRGIIHTGKYLAMVTVSTVQVKRYVDISAN